MFTRFKKEKKILFIDTTTQPLKPKEEERYCVVLSPKLYWVHRFSLPVQNPKAVKKLLPSLFEEFLPQGNYSYDAYIQGDDIVGFAYEQEVVKRLLEEKNIPFAQIEGVYFFQGNYDLSMLPLAINDKEVLVEQNGVVVVVPLDFVQNPNKPDTTHFTCKQKPLEIEHYVSFLSKKTIAFLVAILLVFSTIYAIEWFVLRKNAQIIAKEKEEIFGKYHLMPTSMQNKSLLKKYKKINAKEQKLRLVMRKFFHLHLEKNAKMDSLVLKKGVLKAEFSGVGNTQELIKQLAEYEVHVSKKGKKLLVEVAI